MTDLYNWSDLLESVFHCIKAQWYILVKQNKKVCPLRLNLSGINPALYIPENTLIIIRLLHIQVLVYQYSFCKPLGRLTMGMVVIQPYILVTKLKKTKTKLCLSSIQKNYKAIFIANSSFRN